MLRMDVRVDIAPVRCFAALGAAWRALEAEAADLPFFQSWTWVGCLAEERYPDPVLLRAEAGGRMLGMALFNRRRGRLHLTESGDAALDAPFVEHNGPLLSGAAAAEARRALLHAAWRAGGVRRLVLGGIGPEVLAAAGGAPLRVREQEAPRVDLGAVRSSGAGYLAGLSANTRHQLRRSARRYAERGELSLGRAATGDEALAWLDALVDLHGRTWRRRGMPGAFAGPFALKFHRALVLRAAERDELDLLRVAAGGRPLGYLYNFRLRGHVCAYQSGFDYDGSPGPHAKPGLTCHHLAVERALAGGERVYDFLAGPARYKLSLANAAVPLLWAELVPARSALGLAARMATALRRQLPAARRSGGGQGPPADAG